MDLDISITTTIQAEPNYGSKPQLGLNRGKNEASPQPENEKSGTVAGLPHIWLLRATRDHRHSATVLLEALLLVTQGCRTFLAIGNRRNTLGRNALLDEEFARRGGAAG